MIFSPDGNSDNVSLTSIGGLQFHKQAHNMNSGLIKVFICSLIVKEKVVKVAMSSFKYPHCWMNKQWKLALVV